MDFLDLVKKRYSVRSFCDKPVSDEIIEKILEAGRVSPTACNFQPQFIYVIKSKEGLEKLSKCKFSNFKETLAFIICYDENKCWVRKSDNKNSGDVDASIVTTHMMLEATALGVGSTWVMSFSSEKLREEFDIPSNIIPVSILVMGYESDESVPSKLHDAKKGKDEDIIIL